MEKLASRFSAFWGDERGQSMLETALLVPALLALFLGLWQHVLLELAQTRSILAARHAAWASAYLHENASSATKRARAFFPEGAVLALSAEGQDSENKASNFSAQLAAAMTPPDQGKAWSKATVQATVPRLPFAAPESPGGQYAVEGFLDAVTTHEETCYSVNRSPDTSLYVLRALALPLTRLDILAVKAFTHFLRDKLMDVIKEALIGEGGDATSEILDGVIDVITDGLEDLIDFLFDL